jgi:hypothetical protein
VGETLEETYKPALPEKGAVAQIPTLPQAPAQPPAATAPPAVPTRALTPEEQEFMDALTKLFTTAQEFGLTLASIETDANKLPPDVREVVEQGREVARAVKNFQRIIKKRMGTV